MESATLVNQLCGVLPFFHWGAFHTKNQYNVLKALGLRKDYAPVLIKWCN